MVKFSGCFFAFGVLSIFGTTGLTQVPHGVGQLSSAPQLVPGGVDDEGLKYSYLAQKADNGKLIFTASNGFFTNKTCKAEGTSKLPKVGDEELIVPNFAFLNWGKAEGSLRWHVLIKRPGKVTFDVHLENAERAKVTAKFGEQIKVVTTGKVSSGKSQPWDLSFDVKNPGEYQFSLQAEELNGNRVGDLHRIDVYGAAVAEASLLRVRWRPAAVHGGYDTEKVKQPRLLVFTTRSVQAISSYSPITTPFGYYGTSFDADRRSNGSFNFSMWGKKGAESDLKTMPHLLGVGDPEGEFSGFGHEGSGVKPRGWVPMPDRPELCVQALRVVPEEKYDVYYGYYFDHPTKQWKLYGAGKKWHSGKSRDRLKLGSFCEVPGPPQNQRSGDIYREVRRKGWAYDDGKWVPLEKYLPGSKGGEPVNKRWYTTEDGEYAMGCGGIRLYPFTPSLIKASKDDSLPYFLKNESIQTVFQMPIQFGSIHESKIASNGANIDIEISKGEALSDGVVYFGTKDALTFAPRKLHGTEKGSALSNSINEQVWQNSVEFKTAQVGKNQVTLSGLKPDTTYFYRVLVNSGSCRVWSHDTLSFKTPLTGTVAAAPDKMSFDHLEFRTWAYEIKGKNKTLEGKLTGVSDGKIQIERKVDGKRGTMDLKLFSPLDKEYVESAIR